MKIKISSEFKNDFKTRIAGERLRHMIIESLHKETQTDIDFSDIVIASISFFDEAIIKLADEKLSIEQLSFLSLSHIFRRDVEIIDSLAKDKKFDLSPIQISPRAKTRPT